MTQPGVDVTITPDWLAGTFDIGRPHSLTLAGRGQNNPLGVLRLETSVGCFAIKQMEREPQHAAIQIELAAHESGFPMPRPIRARSDDLFAIHSHGQRRVWVRAYTWAEGMPYDWGVVDPGVSVEVGRLLATLHALRVPEEALREDPWLPPGRNRWQHLAEQGKALELPWAQTLQDKVPVFAAWEEHIYLYTVENEPKVPSQRDLHPPNVIRQHDGRHVLIDWEGAGPVDARAEVTKFALIWATPEGEPPRADAVRAFIDGYRAAGGQFSSGGISDLTHQIRSLLWWIQFNVERDVNRQPDATPDLTLALLSHIREPDLETLARTATLFRD